VIRARALHAPVILASLTLKKGRCALPGHSSFAAQILLMVYGKIREKAEFDIKETEKVLQLFFVKQYI
jgi:hypothetical protein